ncbi:MAG: HEAT repeat domain-containing protein [Verrucomicrobia bacterium]|nr:HEAT repeat domain-containing protein [Verrucomicrobiota bacterium]
MPVLIEIAQHSDPISQSWAISALSDFGRDALAAVPVLLPFLSSTNAFVRDAATNALLEIAPDALTNAPVQ